MGRWTVGPNERSTGAIDGQEMVAHVISFEMLRYEWNPKVIYRDEFKKVGIRSRPYAGTSGNA